MEVTAEEKRIIKSFMEDKALALRDHENRNSAIVSVPTSNWIKFAVDDGYLFSIKNNTFKEIIDHSLIEAHEVHTDKFGTGVAYDVIKAIIPRDPVFDYNLRNWIRFFSHERFNYIFKISSGVVEQRVLRLDLFRHIRKESNGGRSFVGGLFHAFKHFSRDGINYSTGKGGVQLNHPQELIHKISIAFFMNNGVWEKESDYVVFDSYDEKYNLKYVFYKEKETDIFFLRTVYKVQIK